MKPRDYINRIQAITQKRCPRSIDKKTGKATPWNIVAHRLVNGSLDIAFHVPNGYSANDLRQETDSISAACGKIIEIHDFRGVAVVSIYQTDFPNFIPANLSMLDCLKSKREVLIGFDRKGEAIIHNFRVPHLMIAGMSGYGKTDMIRWIILQLIARHTPEELCIDIIDMKGFSFLPFRGIPHIKIYLDLPSALAALKNAKTIMEKRSKTVWKSNNRNLAETFQWHIIIIDEASQIAPQRIRDKERRKLAYEADSYAADISCIGREAGLGLIYCTQRPDSETINGQVKANMEASIGFRTKTLSNSEIIIDRSGLEKLPAKKPGRAIYASSEDTYIQVPYVGKDDDWDTWLEPYKGADINGQIIGTVEQIEEYDGDLD